ncbi:hypothetical protein K491DRAFT_676272 [Lophiostoma macrostomum CBS 122681]|uniref:DUF7580 domain-containing protein n=1 Tax=Lophiostoma macrostomum CBS 122681 TaxID=1314788 RepID=A0A6A6TIC9_9PLEO|nr:hypothetical protein K491DRAFT_676272 [Lophiostoma macrostomum CBS 122681]
MSGFEVAGVVLGSLPLIISAMEHYAEGIATAKRFWRYKSEMRSLILQINTERGIFINTLEQLLTGIVRIEQMADFLLTPGGEMWREMDVDAKLKDRLRSAYQVYLDNVRGMEVSLKKMMEKLALGEDGKVQFSDPNTFKQEIKRLKFSISKSEYGDQLTSLRNYNQALTRLTKQSLELEPTRAEIKTICPNYKGFQNYARSLYATLKAGWCCGCQGHAVNLRLENRSKIEREEEVVQKTPFRVVFSYISDASNSPTTTTLSLWNEVDIKCIADDARRVPPTVSHSRVMSVQRKRRQVRFDQQVQLSVDHTTSSTTAALLQTATLSTPIASTPSQIQHLCEAIAKLQQPQRDICIGYLMDTLHQRKHGIYPLQPPGTQQHWESYSLGAVLNQTANINRRLTRHDKLRVAVDLASSVLQLYKTPWLDEQWGKEDVLFIRRPGAPIASLYEHPFVCRKFTSQSTAIATTPASRAACRVIRNQTLFTLGILLIELWYGKPIEELQQPCDLDCQGTPGVTWCTADRLIETEFEFEAGKRYSDAVRRCIRCDFDRSDMSLDNENFQKAVYQGVVALLERTLQQFTSLD